MLLKGAFSLFFTQQPIKSLLMMILGKQKISILTVSCDILLCWIGEHKQNCVNVKIRLLFPNKHPFTSQSLFNTSHVVL